VLVGCSRYYLKLDRKRPATSAPRDWHLIGKDKAAPDTGLSGKQWSYMVIEGGGTSPTSSSTVTASR
jgi:hypothetical protein